VIRELAWAIVTMSVIAYWLLVLDPEWMERRPPDRGTCDCAQQAQGLCQDRNRYCPTDTIRGTE